jgi:hypothetical protein
VEGGFTPTNLSRTVTGWVFTLFTFSKRKQFFLINGKDLNFWKEKFCRKVQFGYA